MRYPCPEQQLPGFTLRHLHCLFSTSAQPYLSNDAEQAEWTLRNHYFFTRPSISWGRLQHNTENSHSSFHFSRKGDSTMNTSPALLNDQLVNMTFITTYTNCSDKWFYKLISEGLFPKPIKLGRSSRWLKSEVETWMQQRITDSRGNWVSLCKKEKLYHHWWWSGRSQKWIEQEWFNERSLFFRKQGFILCSELITLE